MLVVGCGMSLLRVGYNFGRRSGFGVCNYYGLGEFWLVNIVVKFLCIII